jgi:hypothetical protein
MVARLLLQRGFRSQLQISGVEMSDLKLFFVSFLLPAVKLPKIYGWIS